MNAAQIIFLHQRLADTSWMFMLMVCLWAGVLYFRHLPVEGHFLGIVAVGEGLMVAQAGLGLWLWLAGGLMPGRMIHFLYGSLTVLVLPAIYYYTGNLDEERQKTLIWTLTGLFMFGLALRAAGTGPMGG